jgi:hypothetical protein
VGVKDDADWSGCDVVATEILFEEKLAKVCKLDDSLDFLYGL